MTSFDVSQQTPTSLRQLIKKTPSAITSFRGDNDCSLIHCYASLGNIAMIKACKELGYDPTAVDANERGILFYSMKQNNIDVSHYAASQLMIDPFQLDSYGCTCLHAAVAAQSIDQVRWCLSKDIHLVDSFFKFSPLQMALKKGNREIIKLLQTASSSTKRNPDIRIEHCEKVSSDQLQKIISLEKKIFPKNEIMDMPREVSKRNTKVVIATDSSNNTLVGYLLYTMTSPEACVIKLAVSSSHRRQGIARMLLDASFVRIQSARLKGCCLHVDTTRDGAISLYESVGFKCEDLILNYYSEGRHAHHMIKQMCVT